MSFPIAVLLALALSFPTTTLAGQSVLLKKGRSFYSLGRHQQYLADKQKRWTIEQVASDSFSDRFIQSDSEAPNFGFTTNAYWFRLGLLSQLDKKQKYYLEIPHPVLDGWSSPA
jgi:hypothetical protein